MSGNKFTCMSVLINLHVSVVYLPSSSEVHRIETEQEETGSKRGREREERESEREEREKEREREREREKEICTCFKILIRDHSKKNPIIS